MSCNVLSNEKIHIFFRAEKQLSVFNVVKFPNDPCGAANGYNGTCFTNTECISRGGSSSGIVIWTFNIFKILILIRLMAQLWLVVLLEF